MQVKNPAKNCRRKSKKLQEKSCKKKELQRKEMRKSKIAKKKTDFINLNAFIQYTFMKLNKIYS